MRSRVTPKTCPISSSFRSSPSMRPKRIWRILASFGGSVLRTFSMSSLIWSLYSSSSCVTASSSSTVSCSWPESESDDVDGDSSDSCVAVMRAAVCSLFTEVSSFAASSSSVGSRPSSPRISVSTCARLIWRSCRCSGTRRMRDWSAIALVIACRIHQCEYVENLKPRSGSNRSTPRIRPCIPSDIRSGRGSPRLMYFFAMDTTSLWLLMSSCCFASRHACSSTSNSSSGIPADSAHFSIPISSSASSSSEAFISSSLVSCWTLRASSFS
mmetsp:Transcript_7234/g.17367  ORF Transcript_7234/g.17367 Transcript_7234/m.17367 type:complete len:270 (-) Transcript_7234:961-1770(-)